MTMSEKLVNEREATGPQNQTLNQVAKTIGAIPSLISLVLGALILAEGVYGFVTGNALFFHSVEPSFKAALGFIVLTLTSDKALDVF